MTPEQFVYWLQGYMEIHHPSCIKPSEMGLTEHQVQIIKDHLKTVFDKQTPIRQIYKTSDPYTPDQQDPFGQKYTITC